MVRVLLLMLLEMDVAVPSSLLERVEVAMDGVVTSAVTDATPAVVVVVASVSGGGDLVCFFFVDMIKTW